MCGHWLAGAGENHTRAQPGRRGRSEGLQDPSPAPCQAAEQLTVHSGEWPVVSCGKEVVKGQGGGLSDKGTG